MNIYDIHSRRPVVIDPAGDPTDGPAPSETLEPHWASVRALADAFDVTAAQRDVVDPSTTSSAGWATGR